MTDEVSKEFVTPPSAVVVNPNRDENAYNQSQQQPVVIPPAPVTQRAQVSNNINISTTTNYIV